MLFCIIPDLSTGIAILFILCIFFVCIFEFINGFHDTANAVATVIYTKSLKPVPAVIWSGIWNFLGVIVSSYWGLKVAMNIANLLPLDALMSGDTMQSVLMIISVLLAAMVWNLGTWYIGIPCSSSHTLIGSLLGVGLAYSMLPGNESNSGVNWAEASKIGKSLLLSPAFGFTMSIVLMFLLRSIVRNKAIFKEPTEDSRPPTWIRGILITTCTLVSFFHGQNDGQKGIGLLWIILIVFMPLKFALSPDFDQQRVLTTLSNIQAALPTEEYKSSVFYKEIGITNETIEYLKQDIAQGDMKAIKTRIAIRKRITFLTKNLKVLVDEPNAVENSKKRLIKDEISSLDKNVQFIPFWAVLLISLSLGAGTMIGWKRIVITIGEKIGKKHMTYAEGATAELIAASTIGIASQFGLPVSTTHVLSSGVAGSMVASKGIKNLQNGTIKNIVLAWLLTLPVTIVLSGGMFYIFYLIF